MFNPGIYNFVIYQGSTLRKQFTWTANGTPLNLTGYSARCQLRTTIGSPVVSLDMTTENGGVIIGNEAGTITLYAPAASTAALTASEYVYDLEVIDTVGDVSRLLQGRVSLSREVTR